MNIYPLTKAKVISILFIVITTMKGAPIRSAAPFLRPKKMFNSKMISGDALPGTSDTEPMR